MTKTKEYCNLKFKVETIDDAFAKLMSFDIEDDASNSDRFTVHTKVESWSFDEPTDFYPEYRKPFDAAYVRRTTRKRALEIDVREFSGSKVEVSAPTKGIIHEVFEIFERGVPAAEELKPTKQPQPKIFIGHGRSPQWKDLKDHLHEKHGYEVVAYEIGVRTGFSIDEILRQMLDDSSFAVLVMTGEDVADDGSLRPRLNVVHETGLFQGKLGFKRAIVVLESGTADFSNIQGIDQLRYTAGAIKETFGDVVAAIRREFPWA